MDGFGGFGGGMGGSGNMNMQQMMQQMQNNPQMMQQVQQMMQNPQVAALLRKPGVREKFMQMAQNPTLAQQYMADPDVAQLVQLMQGGGMGGGMGANQPQSQPTHQLVTYIQSETQFMDIIHGAAKDKLIVVDFFATWCGPCKMISPEFDRLAKYYAAHAIFLKIDVDKNQSLAMKRGSNSVPTFHFYKNKIKIAEMRGANAKKLEDLITQNISFNPNNVNNNNNNNKQAKSYTFFPLQERNKPIYPKHPNYKKMKDKFSKVNAAFQSQNDASNVLTDDEFKLLMEIADMVANKMNYAAQKFNETHYKLLEKLLRWPNKCLPPVLDLLRILSLHPSFAEYCSKNFDTFVVDKILRHGANGLVNATNGMLTCRIIINLLNKRISARVMQHKFGVIMDYLLCNQMVKEKANTRKAFVRVLLHFAYCFYTYASKQQLYKHEKIQCLSLCADLLNKETDNDIILTVLMCIGTLIYTDINVIQFANMFNMGMVFKSLEQKYKKQNEQIGNCCDELIQEIS